MKSGLIKAFLFTAFFLGTINCWAQVTIGSDIEPLKGIYLDLKQDSTDGTANSDKGVMLPRVNLQALNSLEPLLSTTNATVMSQYKGTVVYNVNGAPVDLREGLYYWDGTKWDASVTEMPKDIVQSVSLDGNQSTDEGTNIGGGVEFLTFESPITIPEDGAYAFSFKLYGTIMTDNATQRCAYYISLWKGDTLVDIAEIDILASNASGIYTYSIMLGGPFSKNEVVNVKVTHARDFPQWILTDRNTSMLWWRL